MRLDNPLLVQWEYASEERLAKRNAILRALIEGENPEEEAFRAIAEAKPRRVLDVGCGTGELAERVARELDADVVAIDISQRMVELTRARGIEARVADVHALPFADCEFDCVAACWVLYHASDVDAAIAECARVLQPGGLLVAATVGDNIPEVWELIGEGVGEILTFNVRDGRERLERSFTHVEQRDITASMVFPGPEAMRAFVAATINRAHLAPKVPDFRGEFRATVRHSVFVAEKAAG
jgi:SAM-dependent methyltransferase